MMRLPVYLDRDGVINLNRNDYVRTVDDWVPISGAAEAIARLSSAGHPVVVVSNQSAVARGFCSLEDVQAIHRRLCSLVKGAGGRIAGIYFCPHHPEEGCSCRKPATGLVERAVLELALPPGGYIVGDADTDMELGRRLGLKTVMVLTGRGSRQMELIRKTGADPPWRVTGDIVSAAGLILNDAVEEDFPDGRSGAIFPQ